MHTVKVGAAGFGLLALCALAGRSLRGKHGVADGALLFVPLWGVGTAVNLYAGVKHAGYSVAEELPIAGALFAVPALAATGLWWRFRQS